MIEIQLKHDQIAFLDEEDCDLVGLRWVAVYCPTYANGGKYIANRTIRLPSGKITVELMHRVILSRMLGRPLLRSERVDHIHGNPLDNRRSELRLATPSQNGINRGKKSGNLSGFKGVTPSGKRWKALITFQGKTKYLGTFDTPEEAHEVYCKVGQELFGEFFNPG